MPPCLWHKEVPPDWAGEEEGTPRLCPEEPELLTSAVQASPYFMEGPPLMKALPDDLSSMKQVT